MTTTQLINSFREVFKYDLDGPVNEDSTDARIVWFLNEALRIIGLLVPIRKHKLALNLVEGEFQIDARSRVGGVDVRKIDAVYVDGRMLTQLAYPHFLQVYPNFQYVPNAFPSAYALEQPAMLVFNCPFSASALTQSWTITALVNPTALSVDAPDAEPVVPADLHIHLYRLAAALSAKEYSLSPEQMLLIGKMEREARSEIQRYGSQINAPIYADYRREVNRGHIDLS